jgi:hypothetical protein
MRGILIIIVLIGIIFGVIRLVGYLKNRSEIKRQEQRLALDTIITSRAQLGLTALGTKDSDGDGLPDWREALWQLDPNNPDTDGNGVLDGDQVRLATEKLEGSASTLEQTTTDLLARDIYTAVTVLQQSGQLDDQTSERLTTEIATAISDAVPVPVYDISDITIISDTETSRVAYQQRLATLLSQFSADDFAVVLETALVTNPDDVDPVKPAAVITKYQAIRTGMLDMNVPSGLAGSHIEMLNTMSRLVENMRGIVQANEDPLVGLASVTQLESTIDQFIAIISG